MNTYFLMANMCDLLWTHMFSTDSSANALKYAREVLAKLPAGVQLDLLCQETAEVISIQKSEG